MLSKIKYLNCFLGLILLMFYFDFQGRIHIIKRRKWHAPHFLYRHKGWYYHFKADSDICPMIMVNGKDKVIINVLVFRGDFVRQNRIYTSEVEYL